MKTIQVRLWHIARVPLSASLLTLVVGCGSGKTDVSGSVSYGNKPVVWGTVILEDETGMVHNGDIDLQGNFKVLGVAPGSVKIGVTSPSPVQNKPPIKRAPEDPRSKIVAPVDTRPKPPSGAWFALPREVGDPGTSKLTGVVEPGKPLNISIGGAK